ncbi:MAG: hypothetical protein MMC33_001261 [Icmadophila ericetorum]|nr:hypothetical protein [Icmadophila ericetorum]
MTSESFLQLLGPEIQDVDEEVFLLFSQSIPSQNLGFIDAKAKTLELTIAGRDFTIHQSPSLLSSNRSGGTTGAVVWKIGPLFAEWLSSRDNILFSQSILTPASLVLELGCGISGLVGLMLTPLVTRYIATDQDYVSKLLIQNLEANIPLSKPSKPSKSSNAASKFSKFGNTGVEFMELDWETSSVSSLPSSLAVNESKRFDAIISCDCIYNEALIDPYVRTCKELCQLREVEKNLNPTFCIVGQQLRSSDVFEEWLKSFHRSFRVWRIPDEYLILALRSNSGFVIHLGVLR